MGFRQVAHYPTYVVLTWCGLAYNEAVFYNLHCSLVVLRPSALRNAWCNWVNIFEHRLGDLIAVMGVVLQHTSSYHHRGFQTVVESGQHGQDCRLSFMYFILLTNSGFVLYPFIYISIPTFSWSPPVPRPSMAIPSPHVWSSCHSSWSHLAYFGRSSYHQSQRSLTACHLGVVLLFSLLLTPKGLLRFHSKPFLMTWQASLLPHFPQVISVLLHSSLFKLAFHPFPSCPSQCSRGFGR